MLHLWHTLYLTKPDIELHLDGQALRVVHSDGREDHIPLHSLNSIITFSYGPVSQNVMAACADKGIGLTFLSQTGRFRFRIQGRTQGNVLLRQRQYLLADSERLPVAAAILRGKIYNESLLLAKARRNHPEHGGERLKAAETALRSLAEILPGAMSADELRGIEGQAAKLYFRVFPELILTDDAGLRFSGRNRRPPKDPCNALLSFAYTMLAYDCLHAAESVGLDPYVGVLHSVRPGKPSLALDLMEEFRPVIAERLVLDLINLRMISSQMFQTTDEEGVHLTHAGRKVFLEERNRMRQRKIRIPGIDDRVPLGLLPYLQAQRISRFLRGEEEKFLPIARR